MGNAQAVANEQQIIIATDVTDEANDVRQTIPMVDQTVENLDAAGVEDNIKAFTADAGYFSEENMEAVDSNGLVVQEGSPWASTSQKSARNF